MFNTRAEQTTQTTGTGTFTLDPPATGRRSMANAAGGTGKKIYYIIEDSTGANWEEGWGTVTVGAQDTLTRNVIRSSNADQLVSFITGSKRIYCAENADLIRFGAIGDIPTAGGTANALTIGFFPTLRHLKAGQRFMWFPNLANTSAATLDLDGFTGVPIRKGDGTVALTGGEMQPATLAIGVYDEGGGGRIILTNPNIAQASGRLLNVQYITATGTYTPTTGTGFAIAHLVGGGGSGGRTNTGQPGGGGGGGGYARKKITAPTAVTVTIGAGGAAQSTDNTAGNAGGTTSYGAVFTATGGAGGQVANASGFSAGGNGSGGDLNIKGGNGYVADSSNSGTHNAVSSGGNSGFGYGSENTIASFGTGYTGTAGNNYGGGGTGSSTGNLSGAGAPGLCVIEEYS